MNFKEPQWNSEIGTYLKLDMKVSYSHISFNDDLIRYYKIKIFIWKKRYAPIYSFGNVVAYSIEVLCQVEVAALLKKIIGFDYLLGETFEYEVIVMFYFLKF